MEFAWIANEFKGINGVYAKINSAFRSNAEQVKIKKISALLA
jgi:hypothetical protein